MAVTVELPCDRWEKELAAFSRRNSGRPVRLEVQSSPSDGGPLLAEHQPLIGIDFDPRGSEAPAIEIAVGAPSGGSPAHLTHVVNGPEQIWVEEEPDGLGIAVKIASREAGTTMILFEPEMSLPSGR